MPSRQINEFLQKGEQEIIELVAGPARGRHQLALHVPACPVHVEQHGLWGSRAHGGAFRQVAQPHPLSLLRRRQNANLQKHIDFTLHQVIPGFFLYFSADQLKVAKPRYVFENSLRFFLVTGLSLVKKNKFCGNFCRKFYQN